MLVDWGNENDRFIRINCDQGAFSPGCIMTGMNEFLMELLDEDYEEDINNLLDATYDVTLRMHELCWATGAHMTSYGNSSEGCSVVSPAVFRQFAKERETRLAKDLKTRGRTPPSSREVQDKRGSVAEASSLEEVVLAVSGTHGLSPLFNQAAVRLAGELL